MIKIAVVDNEKADRDLLMLSFSRLAEQVQEEICAISFDSGEALLAGYDYSYDLVCLDIDMPGQDGLSTARALRKIDEQVMIIFVTNMAQMAICGYEVQALDFLVKPVNYYSLAMKMRNVIALIHRQKKRNIVLHMADGMVKISTDELYYIEVNGHYLTFHTYQGVFQQKVSLREWEEKLKDLSFVRCNNCYLVNLKHVSAVNKDEVKAGGQWLRMSRPRKKPFLQALANYMGGVVI